MCIHEFHLSNACGHHFPKLPPSATPGIFFNDHRKNIALPQTLTCGPVKLALKFYHDQVIYLPADMGYGAKIEIPRVCPIVHHPRNGVTLRAMEEQQIAEWALNDAMLMGGLGEPQVLQAEINARILDQCSNRSKPGRHKPAALRQHKQILYPPNLYQHCQNLKAYQARDLKHMTPNVRYIEVDFGCGGPFSAECVTGWTGVGLLTHRLHLWGDATTHPRPCNQACLAGWSGAELDTYRRQTWAGHDPKKWTHVDSVQYPPLASEHMSKHHEHEVRIDYSELSHRHADQFKWDGTEYVRINQVRIGSTNSFHQVHVPDVVLVPVPERLDQVLRKIGITSEEPGWSSLDDVPEETDQTFLDDMPEGADLILTSTNDTAQGSDQTSISHLLRHLTEAFTQEQPLSLRSSRHLSGSADGSATEEGPQPQPRNAQGSDGGTSTVKGESPPAQQLKRVETPEEEEERRQRAMKAMREKINRDFPVRDKGGEREGEAVGEKEG